MSMPNNATLGWAGAAALGLIVLLATFSGGGDDEVPQAIVDQNQVITQQNAELNANAFRTSRYPDAVRVLVDSDSTVSSTCRFGDGWASGELVMPDDTTVAIKCQTTGRGKGFNGCLTKEDFVTKAYAKEEGTCNNALTELPKFK